MYFYCDCMHIGILLGELHSKPYILHLSDVALSFEFFNYTAIEDIAGGQLEVCVEIIRGTITQDIQVNVTSSDGTAEGNFTTVLVGMYARVCNYAYIYIYL